MGHPGYPVATGPGTYGVCYIVRTGTGGWAASDATVIEVKPKLEIMLPIDGDKYTYNQSVPGILAINCQAQVLPNSVSDQIEWTITDSPGSTLKPETHTGTQTFFNYEGLPADNSQFGVKTIIASIPQYDIADTINVKIYYPKYATNNPGNNLDPNWYYYWKQTSATKEPSMFGGQYCDDTTNGYFLHWQYSSAEPYFHICANAAETCNFISYFHGIDNFGKTSLHEYCHFDQWWNSWGNNSYSPLTDDPDGDFLPTAVEILANLDPYLKSTYLGINDWELYAIKYSFDRWVTGFADKDDWADPGHQY